MADTDLNIAIYEASQGNIQVLLDQETIWLSQRQLAELLETSIDNISLHLKNIYKEGELTAGATTEDYSIVQQEGQRQVRRKVKHYNLDAIISVAYRVNSRKGTQFRQWATSTLKEHLTRGYEPVINDIGLSALTLLVAESDPKHKETLIRLIMNMLAPEADL